MPQQRKGSLAVDQMSTDALFKHLETRLAWIKGNAYTGLLASKWRAADLEQCISIAKELRRRGTQLRLFELEGGQRGGRSPAGPQDTAA